MITLLGTGMRIGECLGLTWADINFEACTIAVNRSLGYRPIDGKCSFYISTPKTHNGTRIIPMSSAVLSQLSSLHSLNSSMYSKPSPVLDGCRDFVFRNRTGDLLSAHNVNRAIMRIIKEINAAEEVHAKAEGRKPVFMPHFSVHTFRHTFCTRLCENEVDIAIIQQLMGHSDISTTLGIYNHITQERLSAAIQRMSIDPSAVSMAEGNSLSCLSSVFGRTSFHGSFLVE